MIKAVIFDFDGVILESVKAKTDAFKQLFAGWPAHVETMAAYHLKNTGISRYVKIRYFYEEVLKEACDEATVDKMARQYAQLVQQGVKEAAFVKGAKQFLEQFQKKYTFFVVSGTPQDELREIVESRGLNKYFKGVFGSPDTKDQIIDKILIEEKLAEDEVAFVGDGESDLRTADLLGLNFILRETPENVYIRTACDNCIGDLTELETALRVFEKRSIKKANRRT